MKLEVRGPYNYDPDAASAAAGFDTGPESKVQQSQKDEADINVIVRRFAVTGQLPTRPLPPNFGDFTTVTDFHDAQNRIAEAKSAFMSLPAEVRSRFDNDPGKFVDFATKEENYDQLVQMGLADAPRKATEVEAGGGEPPRPDPSSPPKGAKKGKGAERRPAPDDAAGDDPGESS